MQVRDFMIRNVYTVKPNDSIRDLLVIMHNNSIGGVPVVDEEDHLVGIISDGDVLRYLSPTPVGFAGLVYIIEDGEIEDVIREKLQTKVKEIMTKRNVISVSPEEDFELTVRLLSKHRLKKLPVVNGAGRVVGVLSRGDLIKSITAEMILDK